MQEKVVEEQVDLFEVFPEQIRENVIGLAYLGHIEEEVEFCGHTFTLRTLRPSEKAAVAMVTKPYRESLAEAAVWANAHVGLALTAIDGDEAFCPPTGPDLQAFCRTRLGYLTDAEHGWYQPVLDFLFNFYLSLEEKSLAAMKAFQDLAARSQQPSQPSADSSTDKGISIGGIDLDSLPSDTSS